MKIIKLTKFKDSKAILINTRHLQSVSERDGFCSVSIEDYLNSIEVKETVEEIERLLNEEPWVGTV